MNEIISVPSTEIKYNPLNNNLLPLLLLVPLLKGPLLNDISSQNSINLEGISSTISSTINSLNLNNIRKGVDILIKAGPYLPEPMINIMNSMVPYYEKINRIIKFVDFMTSNNSISPIQPVSSLNNREKVRRIITIVEEEIINGKLDNFKPIIDLITNIDKYTAVIKMLSVINDPSNNSENQMENIVNVMTTLMGGTDEKNGKKMKDMMQMIELMKILNSSDEDD